jgi:5'-phosphate synthase pdxT subunit
MPPPAGLVTPCGQSTTIWKLAEIFGLADPLHTGRLRDAGLRVLRGHDHARRPACRPASGQETLGAIDTAVRPNAFAARSTRSRPARPSRARRRPLPRRVHPRAERVSEDAEVLAAEPRTRKVVAARQGPALATAFHPS